MKIYRVRITREMLAALPPAERDFLLLAGHMLNEMNTLHKAFAWASTGSVEHTPVSQLEGNVSTANALIYARLLAGKEWEAWEVMRKAWFGTRISQQVEPMLPVESQSALKALKTYFNASNLIYAVRNSFAFHYSAEAIGATWERALEESFFETILGGNIGNNFYLAAEIAANVAVFNTVHSVNLQEGMRRFLSEVAEVSRWFVAFLEGVNMAIYQRGTGEILSWDHGTPDEVFPAKEFSKVGIPHFCLPEPTSPEPAPPSAGA